MFLDRFSDRFHTGPVKVPPGFHERLLAWPWPGNVRELENTLESLVALSHEGELDPGLIPGSDPSKPAPPPVTAGPGSEEPVREPEAAASLGLKERVEAYERGLILDAMRLAGGNRSEAARRLGIGRATLHDKLRKYGMDAAASSGEGE
jgi:two-component system response regulator HydG